MIPTSTPVGAASWREEIADVLRREFARWRFVFSATLAAILALGASMVLQLTQPSTAMLTVLIVMQPMSGAVLAKSFYRALGNFAGGIFALLLFALFAQQVPLLLGGLAVWVAVCTAGSIWRRNDQSYGFVLSGYTACIIAFPSLATPDNVLNVAIMRISEVFVGIVCAALVSETVFPGSVQRTLRASAKERIVVFGRFARGVLTGTISQADIEKMQLHFIRDVVSLDAYGISASFEAGGGHHKQNVRLFNAGFMAVSTSLYALHAFAKLLPSDPRNPVTAFFRARLSAVADSLAMDRVSIRSSGTANATVRSLASCWQGVERELRIFAHDGGLDDGERHLLENGGHLLRRFVEDMTVYLTQYEGLARLSMRGTREDAHYSPGVDHGIAVISGVRTALILGAVAVYWWGTAWSDGSSASIFAVVFCGILAAGPNPIQALILMATGCCLGIAIGMVFCFAVLPSVTDFLPLCAVMFPFLAIGPYMSTIPRTAAPGRAFNFMFASFANPGLALTIDPAGLTGGALAKMFGLAIACGLLVTFFPSGGEWWKKRLKRRLLREAAKVCRSESGRLLPHFESRIRDTLLQFVNGVGPTNEEKREMLERSLAVSDFGRVIIEIRRHLVGRTLPAGEERMLREVLAGLSDLLRSPNDRRYRESLSSIRALSLRLDSEARGKSFELGGTASLVRLLQYTLVRLADTLGMFSA